MYCTYIDRLILVGNHFCAPSNLSAKHTDILEWLEAVCVRALSCSSSSALWFSLSSFPSNFPTKNLTPVANVELLQFYRRQLAPFVAWTQRDTSLILFSISTITIR